MPKQNTLNDWQSDFADLGITASILTAALTQMKNPNFSELFELCHKYVFLLDEMKLPYIASDWQLILFSQEQDLIKKIIHQDGKLDNYPLEVLAILILSNPQRAHEIFSTKPDLLSSLAYPKLLLSLCAQQGHLELVKLIITLMPSILQSRNDKEISVLEWMARSGNVAGIQYLLDEHPELLAANGGMLLNLAAFSGNVDAFNLVNEKVPNLLQERTQRGGTCCAHFAARSGNLNMLQRVHTLAPTLFDAHSAETTHCGAFAARSITPNGFQNFLTIQPNLNLEAYTNKENFTVLHQAAEYGTVLGFQSIMNTCPKLIAVKSVTNRTVVHSAALSRTTAMLREALSHSPEDINAISKDGSVLEMGVLGGNPTSIELIITTAKHLLVEPLKLAQRAIVSRNPLALDTVLSHCEAKLLEQPGEKNPIHAALATGSRLMVETVIKHAPALLQDSTLLPSLVFTGKKVAFEMLVAIHPPLLDLVVALSQGGRTGNILHFAILYNKLDIAKLIYPKRPAFLRQLTSSGYNICWSVADDVNALQWIHSLAPELLLQNNRGTILMGAIAIGRSKVTLWILKNVASLSLQRFQEKNILGWAMDGGYSDSFAILIAHNPAWLQELITQGIDIENFALAFQKKEVLQEIIDLAPELLKQQSSAGCTILHFVAEHAALNELKLVLDKVPQQLYSIDNNGHTVLHHAIRSNDIEKVTYLLNNFPNLAKMGAPILHFATSLGNEAMVNLIFEVVPEQLDYVLSDGTSILSWAALSGNPKLFTDMLQRKPSLLSAMHPKGKSYLHYAAYSNNHVAMIEYLISHYPYESAQWWGRDTEKKQTPDELIKQRGMKPTASVILTNLIKKALLNIVQNNQAEFQSAVDLLEAYKDRFFELLYEFSLFTAEEIQAAKQSTLLQDTLGVATFNRLVPVLTLLQTQMQIANQPLTKEILENLIAVAKKTVELQKTTIYVNKSQFCSDLILFVSRLGIASNSANSVTPLNEDQILTLAVIVHDYQLTGVNSLTRATDTLLLQALEASSSLQGLKPKPAAFTERDINPNTFLNDLTACRALIPELKEDIKKKVETVFSGIEHIINNKNAILNHVRTRYGTPYEVAKDLPIHTNHASKDTPNECYESLQRLVREFIAAFYVAHEAGHLTTFCHKITTGHCLEDILREPLEWVSQLSVIQPFPDLIHRYYKDYLAYQKMMLGKTDEELGDIERMLSFIKKRHNGFLCKPHAQYAPEGVINTLNLSDYLYNVIVLEMNNPAKVARKGR